MMKQSIIIVLALLLASCKNEVSKQTYKQETTQKADVKSYQFDEVVYYSFENENEIGIPVGKNKKANSILQKVTTEDRTSTLKDTVLIAQIETMGFQRTVLSEDKVRRLHFFMNGNHNQEEVNDCLPIYRDILLLRKNNKTTDILKICFQCLQSARISKEESVKIDISDYRYFERILKD